MKKHAISDDYRRQNGLKKHQKKSKAEIRKRSRMSYYRKKWRQNKRSTSKLVNVDSSIFSKHFLNRAKQTNFWNLNSEIKVPKNFCIYTNTDVSLSWLVDFGQYLRNSRSDKFVVNHRKEKSWSLCTEVILGLLANEISSSRAEAGLKTGLRGLSNGNPDHQSVLENVGLISELDNHNLSSADKIHVFKENCRLNESSTSTADDLKTETAVKFVHHIQNALKDHSLKLREEAAQSIKGSLGEILDNAAEHGGLTAPTWFVRGYINNNSQNKELELMVMNLGNSIADTFLNLDDAHPSKIQVMGYVKHHKNSGLSKEQLITVAALQGKISSKNDDESDTRGQGTIKLIEMFEHIFSEYVTLRKADKKKSAVMNLISGSVVVNFDGTYHSKIEKDDEGGERVTIAFNKEESLTIQPDNNYILELNKSYFPGLIINIKIPLSGSITPIRGLNHA